MSRDRELESLPPRLEQAAGRKLRSVAEFLVVSICTLAWALTTVNICMAVLGKNAVGGRDFVEYWASGQQLAHHANPYSASDILRIERSQTGFPSDIPALVMGNAPPALLLVLPLGHISARLGEVLWSVFLSACLLASVRLVWKLHGSPKNQLHYLGYSFGPALVCLGAGQVSVLVLLGLALFLRLHKSSPLLAGASLWLCALKPQLFLPFGVALIAWIFLSRSYKILVGALSAFGISAGIIFALDPHVWRQYGEMMSLARYDKIPIPCLSIMLRLSISPKSTWLQYMPVIFGCAWATTYIWKHRKHWDWVAHGSPLMLLSILVAPYTWLVDQSLLIPALLHGVYLTRSRSMVAVLALASAVIELAPFLGLPLLHSPFYLWTAPGWLAWYLVATRISPEKSSDGSDIHIEAVPLGGAKILSGASLSGSVDMKAGEV
jgi:hypothetical protein